MQLSAASLTGQSEWCDELISWTRDVRNYFRQSGPLLTPVTDKLIFPSTAKFSKRDAGPLSLTCSEN